MSAAASAPVALATNERVELARYTIAAGERVIYGQRVLGVVRLVDVPGAGHGRRYLIERELTVMPSSKRSSPAGLAAARSTLTGEHLAENVGA
jgi:hypothetical protein